MEKERGIKIAVIGCGGSGSLEAIKYINSLNLNIVSNIGLVGLDEFTKLELNKVKTPKLKDRK